MCECKGKERKIKRLIYSLLIFTCITGSAEDQEKRTLKWLVFDQAPYWFSEPPLKGQGLGRKLLNLYIEKLPQFEHQIITVNVARYVLEAKKPNTCIPFAWISEVEAALNQTRAITIEPPMGVFISNAKEGLVKDKEGWIHLRQALDSKQFNFGYINKFDYGSMVNDYLLEQKDADYMNNFYAATGEINLELLNRQRLDMIIGMPVQLKKEQVLGNPINYSFYNILEINNFIKLYSHCSNDEIGNIALAEINKILTDQFLTEQAELYYQWYGQDEAFKEIYTDVVINQNNRTNVYSKFQ